MAKKLKKRSASPPRARLVSASAEFIFSNPVSKAQRAVLNGIARSQTGSDDASIGCSLLLVHS